MPEPAPDTKRERSPLVIAAIVFVALPALYVLSIGPYYWLLQRGYIDHGFNDWFFWRLYAPIRYVEDSVGAFHNFIVWYLSLWR